MCSLKIETIIKRRKKTILEIYQNRNSSMNVRAPQQSRVTFYFGVKLYNITLYKKLNTKYFLCLSVLLHMSSSNSRELLYCRLSLYCAVFLSVYFLPDIRVFICLFLCIAYYICFNNFAPLFALKELRFFFQFYSSLK